MRQDKEESRTRHDQEKESMRADAFATQQVLRGELDTLRSALKRDQVN